MAPTTPAYVPSPMPSSSDSNASSSPRVGGKNRRVHPDSSNDDEKGNTTEELLGMKPGSIDGTNGASDAVMLHALEKETDEVKGQSKGSDMSDLMQVQEPATGSAPSDALPLNELDQYEEEGQMDTGDVTRLYEDADADCSSNSEQPTQSSKVPLHEIPTTEEELANKVEEENTADDNILLLFPEISSLTPDQDLELTEATTPDVCSIRTCDDESTRGRYLQEIQSQTQSPSLNPDEPFRDQRTIHKAPTPPYSERRRVRFSEVWIREYKSTIGDNPCCVSGPPLSLDWEYTDYEHYPIDVFDHHHHSSHRRRCPSMMLLTPTQRCARLFQAGYSMEDMKKAVEINKREKFRRSNQSFNAIDPIHFFQEFWLFRVEPILLRRYNENRDQIMQRRMERELRKVERRVRDEHSQSQGQSQHSVMAFASFRFGSGKFGESDGPVSQFDDSEHYNELDVDEEEAISDDESPRVVIEGMGGLSLSSASGSSDKKRNVSEVKSQDDDMSVVNDDADQSSDTSDTSYGIDVDRKQHDKATEIKLGSLRRPHMRAFHASWFSFFVAFFGWFSITPLLSEIKETLELSNQDIWTSALVGTAGTLIMRVVMGPLCDKFGARLCMATILIISAVPIACTGFVQDAVGLSIVRLFVGIAGSSFVCCQYWTSDMFTREKAGTANALVAGWGNIGGGAAQLIIGSALFPLLRLIYDNTDEEFDDEDGAMADVEDGSELAWRTVFVFPALLCIATGVAIILYSDDSPTGSYKDRIRNETLVVKSPMESLCSVSRNWNVWILTLQYACCFGVEVTMTNATALYFHDEFGQSTVSAAGIASIFGLMNLWARGLGGFCSDWLQNAYGVRGRLAFQMTALILEGLIAAIFPFAESLAGSIVALVFLSILVQSAEGSTFGIVPYASRRFTGSVVGIVGSGGSLGSAIFSVFFLYFHYTPAFAVMGAVAFGSAFLCCLLDTKQFVDPKFMK